MSAPRAEIVVIGGGPAGSAVAHLLASWGHGVVLLTRAADPARGLAESIPPSTRKLFAAVGALDAVEQAGFYRSSGNTVWWASNEPRIERFGDGDGYQVFRPDLDRVLLASARTAGAAIHDDARVRAVAMDDDGARVEYEENNRAATFDCRLVLDCSGRTGVVARRFRRAQPGHRTTALIGVWTRPGGWALPDPTHTTVETFDEGWIWSVPVSADVRHAAVMVETITAPSPVENVYLDAVRGSRALGPQAAGATLDRFFACDASLYRSERYATASCLLVGDAGSFIDPLSSYGVKKALGSAWVAAVAAHTALIDPGRRGIAFEFFNDWEARVYGDYLRRSRDFARDAAAAHAGAFWRSRADVEIAEREDTAAARGQVQAAFERLKAAGDVEFALAAGVRVEPHPVIRDREIVAEPSFAGLRFHEHVDLVALVEVACRCRTVPDACDAYCAENPAIPLPSVLGALSLLVARGVLSVRAAHLENVEP